MRRPTTSKAPQRRTVRDKARLDAITTRGASAAYLGKPYTDNPHPRGTPEHLAWSIGHNGARANLLLRSESL